MTDLKSARGDKVTKSTSKRNGIPLYSDVWYDETSVTLIHYFGEEYKSFAIAIQSYEMTAQLMLEKLNRWLEECNFDIRAVDIKDVNVKIAPQISDEILAFRFRKCPTL